jgi:hypothetical protein
MKINMIPLTFGAFRPTVPCIEMVINVDHRKIVDTTQCICNSALQEQNNEKWKIIEKMPSTILKKGSNEYSLFIKDILGRLHSYNLN